MALTVQSHSEPPAPQVTRPSGAPPGDDQRAAVANRNAPLGTTIGLKHVGKSYKVRNTPLRVLDDINLDIPAGEFLAIVGASGCGKSTLLRLLAGLDTDHDGALLANDAPITGPSLDCGIVFQDPRLLPWLTVEGNIAMAFEATRIDKGERRRRIADHIALVGLKGFEKAHPAQLSGGMAQRAAIARAMVNHPRMILLDEPLAALDYFTRLRLQSELETLWRTQPVTMILVTHDIDEALYLADRIVILKPHPGRIDRIVENTLPRTRERESAAFGALKRDILAAFE